MIDRRATLAGLAAPATMLTVGPDATLAQGYPDKRINIIVGFGAGGMTDVTSRMIARHMEKTFGVNVIVENKTGTGGTLAIGAVAQMPADGHTMVSFAAEAPFTSAYQNRPINMDEWAMIGGYMPQERILFAVKSAPFNTIQEM